VTEIPRFMIAIAVKRFRYWPSCWPFGEKRIYAYAPEGMRIAGAREMLSFVRRGRDTLRADLWERVG
jgi:hypothetical protein